MSLVVNSHEVGKWICERLGGLYSPIGSSSIGLERNGELVAGVLYDNFVGRCISMHVAAKGKNWLNKAFIFTCFDYPFNQLKCAKVLGLVPASNAVARRFDEHLGFSLEHVITDGAKDGDLCIYSMTRDACRYLR